MGRDAVRPRPSAARRDWRRRPNCLASTVAATTACTRSANALASRGVGSAMTGGGNRIVHDERDVRRLGPEAAFRHHRARADDRQRHDRQPGLDRQQEAAGLEARHAAVPAPRALGEDDERQPVRTRAPASASGCRARSGCWRSTNRCPPRFRCQPSTGKRASDALAMIRSWIRQRREDDRDVVDALVVRHEHVRRARARSARVPRPRTRTPVVFRISHDQARAQRCAKWPRRSNRLDTMRRRAEHDRVDADGRDQEEDSPPPVIGRHVHATHN